jgi:hypothetical protein
MVKQKKLLLRCSDDSVIILAMVLNDGHGIDREGTVAEIEDEIKRASDGFPERLPIIGWEEIEDSHLPERTFRNAWITRGGKKIGHDMPKVRQIHMDKLRGIRDRRLADLDGDWMRATGQGKKAEAISIEKKRQTLRDIPQEWEVILEQLGTPEEVGAAWPEELNG